VLIGANFRGLRLTIFLGLSGTGSSGYGKLFFAVKDPPQWLKPRSKQGIHRSAESVATPKHNHRGRGETPRVEKPAAPARADGRGGRPYTNRADEGVRRYTNKNSAQRRQFR